MHTGTSFVLSNVSYRYTTRYKVSRTDRSAHRVSYPGSSGADNISVAHFGARRSIDILWELRELPFRLPGVGLLLDTSSILCTCLRFLFFLLQRHEVAKVSEGTGLVARVGSRVNDLYISRHLWYKHACVYPFFKGRSYRGQNKRKKKRNENTKNRTEEYVIFIGQIIKIESRDPDTSVFTFRSF